GEWQAVDEGTQGLRQAGSSALAHFLSLRPHGDQSMLVVAVRYFFRREVEADPQLFAALSFTQMEKLGQLLEAGYDALHTALQKNAGRLEELMEGALAVLEQVHARVAEPPGDAKGIRAPLAEQGQPLQAVGQAVFRALVVQGGRGQAAPPARKEEDLRLEMLNTLLKTPHRKLAEVWPVHQGLVGKDPRFYVRLAAWYFDKGEVRDHKEMFVVTLCLSDFAGHRDGGPALLSRLPLYRVAGVVDFIQGGKETRRRAVLQAEDVGGHPQRGPGRHSKPGEPRVIKVVREVVGDFGLFRNVPRSLKTEV